MAYLDEDDLVDRMSRSGVDLRVDDFPPEVLGGVIINAGTIIDEYCIRRYTVADMETSEWVHQRATDIAAYLLCARRGNAVPAVIREQYERTLAVLEKVVTGKRDIPDIYPIAAARPMLSKVRVAMAPNPFPVAQRRLSTGRRPTQLQQQWDYPFFYGDGSGI